MGPSSLNEAVEEVLQVEIPEACDGVEDKLIIKHIVSEVTISDIMELKNYSSFERLCRVTGLVLKFVKILKQIGSGTSATLNDEMKEETPVSSEHTVCVSGCASAVHAVLTQSSEELWIIECQNPK
uniref:Uncharacterized protein n=1 Tax=Amphimedon queenslandica TaxID=400682 RepID=A0A1X7SWZ6_AMPQE